MSNGSLSKQNGKTSSQRPGAIRLGELLKTQQRLPDSADVRFYCERFFQEHLKDRTITCRLTRDGDVVAVVRTAALYQEVILLDYDLRLALADELGFKVRRIVARWA